MSIGLAAGGRCSIRMFTRVTNEFNFLSAGGHPYRRLPSVLLQNVPRPGHFRPLLKARVRNADFNFFKRYGATKPFATATYSPQPTPRRAFLDPADESSRHRCVGFQPALVRLNLGKHRQNNWQEWIGGSNPTNPHSFFAISGVALNPKGSNVVIPWPTVPNRLYAVHWSTNATGRFLPLASNLPHTQTNYVDTTAPPNGFYRLNVRLE